MENINSFDIDRVMFCQKCTYLSIDHSANTCPNCNEDLQEIGFVEKKKNYSVGGSVTPGYCKCGNPRSIKGIDNLGRTRYRTQCNQCIQAKRKIEKVSCVRCGLIPTKKSDLDVDHIDGDRSNNNPDNLQVLCKDCHKDKTKENKDWKRK